MIAAAGSGQRLGAGGPKAFVELAGLPLLTHAVASAAAADSIGRVVIAAPPGALDRARTAAGAPPGAEVLVVAGGDSRAESVRRALGKVETELVLIHDAARPLAPAALFDAVAARLRGDDDLQAAIAAAPIVDTVKRSRSGGGAEGVEVAGTVPREDLWSAQTPQGFRVDALLAAQARAAAAGTLAEASDEALLIELNGGRVALEPVAAPNLKVTTAQDLSMAESLLADSRRV